VVGCLVFPFASLFIIDPYNRLRWLKKDGSGKTADERWKSKNGKMAFTIF